MVSLFPLFCFGGVTILILLLYASPKRNACPLRIIGWRGKKEAIWYQHVRVINNNQRQPTREWGLSRTASSYTAIPTVA